MVRFAEFKDNFYDIYRREKRMLVAYGAGYMLNQHFDTLPEIDLVCDKNAGNIMEFRGIQVVEPDKLQDLNEPMYIVVCVLDYMVYMDICDVLKKYHIEAIVFHYFNNIAFNISFLDTPISYQTIDSNRNLSVNIVCKDNGWIFTKFVKKMCEYLSVYDVDVTVSRDAKPEADINHHIPFASFKPYPNDTLMITHVNIDKTFLLLKKQLEIAGMGICMSKETMRTLVSYGIPRSKLCYINPAQDSVIQPKKYVIGIMHRCYDALDVRKRATAVLDVVEGVNPAYFKFLIMGSGWNEIVKEMEMKGFEVEYYPEFIYDTYNLLIQRLDYLLYMGFDEGSMGYLDALAAGVGTIVTPQGFHLDADCPIDYPCRTVEQFRQAFLDLQRKRESRVKAVSGWTWEQYVWKHLEVWNYLLKRKGLKELFRNQSHYMDGIFSVLIEDDRV